MPKHGYRFIAPVERVGDEGDIPTVAPARSWRPLLMLGSAGMVGGGVAGAFGGLFYGFALAAQPGMGGVSVLLVLVCLTILVGLVGCAARAKP